jgi:phage shock protein PspC (stress-responsive transcriptional regulator)
MEMEMRTLKKSQSGNNLWIAIFGLAAGIAMIFGLNEEIISLVAGTVTALESIIIYNYRGRHGRGCGIKSPILKLIWPRCGYIGREI